MIRKISFLAALGVLCALPFSSGYASETPDDVVAVEEATAENPEVNDNEKMGDTSSANVVDASANTDETIDASNKPEGDVGDVEEIPEMGDGAKSAAATNDGSSADTVDAATNTAADNDDAKPNDLSAETDQNIKAGAGTSKSDNIKEDDVSAANVAPVSDTPKQDTLAADQTQKNAAKAEGSEDKTAEATNEDGPKSNTDDAAHEETSVEDDNTQVVVDNGPKGESVRVGLISWRDLPFRTVKHQAYDYSCGSAAVATLMTYAYNLPTSEKEVFEEMFAHGDKTKIQHEGFSMLDMSRYLNNHGLEAQGYMITIHVIEKYEMPIIALVNNKGYNHFVVVKTTSGGRVLVGDPNTGNTEYSKDDFAQIWNGVAIVVTNQATRAHAAFNNSNEWRFARAHVELRNSNDIGNETAELAPLSWQIAPTGPSVLPAFTIGATTSINQGGGS
jgi:hypothetical protein